MCSYCCDSYHMFASFWSYSLCNDKYLCFVSHSRAVTCSSCMSCDIGDQVLLTFVEDFISVQFGCLCSTCSHGFCIQYGSVTCYVLVCYALCVCVALRCFNCFCYSDFVMLHVHSGSNAATMPGSNGWSRSRSRSRSSQVTRMPASVIWWANPEQSCTWVYIHNLGYVVPAIAVGSNLPFVYKPVSFYWHYDSCSWQPFRWRIVQL